MIYSWAKIFGTTPDYVLYEISYENLIMYGCAIPRYNDEKDDWDPSIDANNPDNFNSSNDEEEFVR